MSFISGSTTVGNITSTGGTVSYGAFSGNHWSQFKDHLRPEVYPGTVLETIDEMCDWGGEINEDEQLAKCKVSDTTESNAVYGVFLRYDDDPKEEGNQLGDLQVMSLGAWFVRVDANENVSVGDLLVSAGNGCAKVQSDDIIRSKTIGKVTATKPSTVYPDGSKLIPAVLYCG
jgi:hypothetical protein